MTRRLLHKTTVRDVWLRVDYEERLARGSHGPTITREVGKNMTTRNGRGQLVTVFGGSGFVGRHTVRALARSGWRVRAAVRRPDLAGHLQPMGNVGQIHAVQANVRYPDSVAAAVQGEGIFVNQRGSTGRKDFIFPADGSDFAGEWRAFESAEAMKFDPQRCGQIGVLARGARETAQGFSRLGSLAERFGWAMRPVDFKTNHAAVGRAMLASFSDQLAIRFNQGSTPIAEAIAADGGGAASSASGA